MAVVSYRCEEAEYKATKATPFFIKCKVHDLLTKDKFHPPQKFHDYQYSSVADQGYSCVEVD